MDLKACYKILEINESASLPEIKQAYRDMIGIWHPDRYIQNPRLYAKATEKLKDLNAAYNQLADRSKSSIVKKGTDHKASSNLKPHILFVTCPSCLQKNRLKAGFVTHHPRCGTCGTLLFQKSKGPEKPEKKTGKTTQRSGEHEKTADNSTQNNFGADPFDTQRSETVLGKPVKKRRIINKWTLIAILAGLLLIANNFNGFWLWLSKHIESITEGRYTQYLKKPIENVRNKLDNKDNIAAKAAILELLREAGYSVDTTSTADVTDEQIRVALKQFRDDYSLSFRVGNITESTQALQRHRAILRQQPEWPHIAINPQFKQWIDKQEMTSPEICKQILANGDVAQVTSLLDWYQFEHFKPKPLPLPPRGVLQKKYHKGLAPLTIRARDDGRHYYLKLIDDANASTMMTAFIPSGAKFVEHVPVGKYRVKYAVGQSWYGSRWLFGPKTVFKKMDQVFDFKIQNNQISGYQLDLYLQPMGLISSPKDYAFDF